jgi:PPOX class probable F420-dependent enzyme
MTDGEWRDFLRGPVRPATLATVRRDGRPHVAPIWYDLDADGTIVFTTGADTVKGRNLRGDGRVMLCVQDDQPPFSFVTVEGRAELSDDVGPLREWATRIGGRYMGEDRAEEFGRRNAVPGELLVRVTPAHVVAFKDVAD